MAEEFNQSIPKEKIKRVWKELSYFEIAMIIILIGYFIYLNNSTVLILNTNNGNDTRVINGVSYPPNTFL